MQDREKARTMGAWLDSEHKVGDPFAAAIRSTRMSMLITDPRQSDNPIVFANDAFMELTGYSRDEVIGRNCRLLQGPDTDPLTVKRLRDAVSERRAIFAEILNYRRDGRPFWNSLYLSPVKNEKGESVFFFASQFNVSRQKERELRLSSDRDFFEAEVASRTTELEQALKAKTILLHEVDHRIKNNLQLINSLLALQMRRVADTQAKAVLRATLDRIEALGTVHQRLYQSHDVGAFDLSAFVRDLVDNLVGAAGREDIETEFHLGCVEIAAGKAAPIGLLINEILTNALKHAFSDSRPGRIRIDLERDDGTLRIKIADNGIGIADTAATESGTFGRTLIETLSQQLRARIERTQGNPGTVIAISVPLGRTE